MDNMDTSQQIIFLYLSLYAFFAFYEWDIYLHTFTHIFIVTIHSSTNRRTQSCDLFEFRVFPCSAVTVHELAGTSESSRKNHLAGTLISRTQHNFPNLLYYTHPPHQKNYPCQAAFPTTPLCHWCNHTAPQHFLI